MKFVLLFVSGIFIAFAAHEFAQAKLQPSTTTHSRPQGIDVSDHSSIYFDTPHRNREYMDQLNNLHHQQLLQADPLWELKRSQYEQLTEEKVESMRQNPTAQSTVVIPVVVHIVYNTPVQNVPDSCVYSQMVVLNEDFTRSAADTTDTPAPFAAIAGNPHIQFCLAQRDPYGNPSTGIERRQTSVTTFSTDAVKFYAQGGMDIWDPTRFFNIWVCYTGGVCWGEFPTATTTNTFGAVMNYQTFGSNYTNYGFFPFMSSYFDRGEICVHEIGHCLNLYHIWGDDNGACTGTDNCPDTPNQADASSACLVFPAFDACSPSGNGFMFENYMDYTDDDCLNLFTQGQAARMNAVLSMPPYDGLVTSNGCQPVVLYNNDASAYSILSPTQTVCSTFDPVIVLKNWGSNPLTSCDISYYVDANTPTVYHWTGNLVSIATDTITFPSMTVTPGTHTFTCETSLPNATTDSQISNDQSISNFTALGTGLAIPYSQGFESTTFVPAFWSLVNSDADYTWQRTTNAFSSGTACAMMDNVNYYNSYGQIDEMIMRPLDLTTVANPSMSFDYAYTYYNQTNPPVLYTDTFTVLISVDCGQTFSVIYKKGGAQLATVPPVPDGPAFIPASSDWRTEYISLAPYMTSTNAIIKFRNTSGWGNDLYLDNINLGNALGIQSVDLNSSVTLFPNPTNGNVFVNVDLPAAENITIHVFDVMGRNVYVVQKYNSYGGTIDLDLSNQSNGVYFVEVKTDHGIVTKKLLLDKK